MGKIKVIIMQHRDSKTPKSMGNRGIMIRTYTVLLEPEWYAEVEWNPCMCNEPALFVYIYMQYIWDCIHKAMGQTCMPNTYEYLPFCINYIPLGLGNNETSCIM